MPSLNLLLCSNTAPDDITQPRCCVQTLRQMPSLNPAARPCSCLCNVSSRPPDSQKSTQHDTQTTHIRPPASSAQRATVVMRSSILPAAHTAAEKRRWPCRCSGWLAIPPWPRQTACLISIGIQCAANQSRNLPGSVLAAIDCLDRKSVV